ncbi:hypothetical protein CKM354_000333600 [Cercospora kikuchii]|uniref:Uncharacterized protein n=1 Tax=Cercospora kikuchii TaxID=84275 RepID=A0A9P3FDM1_9PEZI|nr:uncharacterized protein CKM354_000333600 [Cercospora kikuchii]GIZ39977.1 hypothetical protein CKM354_000333600 [Cercospora kikuchii]
MSAAPYPDYRGDPQPTDDAGPDARGRRPAAPGLDASSDPHAHIPLPPLGATLKPALKREGSRSRLHPDERPQFPDEASYLGGRAPDLEAKNRPRDKQFRDLRDGYESDEGEHHKSSKYTPRSKMPRSNDDSAYDDRPRRSKRNDYPPPDSAISGTTRGGYDDGPPRRRRDRDERPPYDDDYPPRRRGDRPPPVEYGADPIPSRQKSERRPRPRREYDDYSDEDDYRPRRRRGRSADGYGGRPPRDYDDDPYYSDRPPRRRRDDDYNDRAPARRRDGSRRRRDDYDDYDRYSDRSRDRRGGRDGRDKPPPSIKIGKYDIGPWVEKGKEHWTTIAPILTPIVLAQIRKMGSGGGSGGGRR